MTPTLIGVPLGLAAAAAVVGAAAAGAVGAAAAAVVGLPCACGTDVAAAAVVGAAAGGGLVGAAGVAAGVEHAANTQATEPTSKAFWLRVVLEEVISYSLPVCSG